MNKTNMIASALAIGICGASAASAAEGMYIGGAVEQSRFDSDNFTVEDQDKEDFGWKVIGGYRFTPHFAIETAYTDFGRSNAPSAAIGGPFEAKADALSAFGVGLLPIGNAVDLYAKAGAARIKAKGNVGAVFFDDKETEFAYGAGVQFKLGNVGLRAEYEKFDTDVIGDLDVISVGLTYTFAFAPR